MTDNPPKRPKTPRDQKALDDVRAEIGPAPTPPTADGAVGGLTPEQRAERLRQRAAARSIGAGGDFT